METVNVYPLSLLKEWKGMYEQMGIDVALTTPTEEAPFHALILELDDFGEDYYSLRLELCFLPHLSEWGEQGVYFLQTFLTVAEGIAPDVFDELRALASKVNLILPLGAFGLIEQGGILYFKHNNIVCDVWNRDHILRLIDQQNGLILQFMEASVDAWMAAAAGRMTAEEAYEAIVHARGEARR